MMKEETGNIEPYLNDFLASGWRVPIFEIKIENGRFHLT
jgi:hypothetical protein